MSETNNYKVEFSSSEIHSLVECLAELRKHYAESGNAKDNSVFIAACELQHKLATTINPSLNIPIERYLEYGD